MSERDYEVFGREEVGGSVEERGGEVERTINDISGRTAEDLIAQADGDAGVPEGFVKSSVTRMKIAQMLSGGGELRAWVRLKKEHPMWNSDNNLANAYPGQIVVKSGVLTLIGDGVEIDLSGGMMEDRNSTKIYLSAEDLSSLSSDGRFTSKSR